MERGLSSDSVLKQFRVGRTKIRLGGRTNTVYRFSTYGDVEGEMVFILVQHHPLLEALLYIFLFRALTFILISF